MIKYNWAEVRKDEGPVFVSRGNYMTFSKLEKKKKVEPDKGKTLIELQLQFYKDGVSEGQFK